MKRDLAALAAEQFDVLVIGGGIIGAGIARDAALRGLRVALIDKNDFASGTSSASSKLIHGGFRYLEQGAFRLVAESCRERAILQRIAPHLVRPREFLFPVYDGDRRSLPVIRLGATLYDWIAREHKHRSLSAERARQAEPALSPTGLRGAVVIHDCQEDDARFCLDNILHAGELGAVCANYCELTGLSATAQVRDRLRGESFEIRAHTFVNATGPWSPVPLSPTKGVHLLVPGVTQSHAIVFQARRDGRVLFVLPWGDCSIVGTTDTDWRGDPGDARAETADVEYLLGELRGRFPDAATNIITTFAGVRALLRSEASPFRRSREHRIIREGHLITVAGGKYTTYRLIAEQVVNQLTRQPCRTAETPLPSYRPPPSGEQIAGDVFASDIRHACEYEMAQRVADVMRRRTGLALSRHGGAETAAKVAQLMTTGAESLQEYLDDYHRASRF
jgi:glycerol-3-phosphate dehydrogenase